MLYIVLLLVLTALGLLVAALVTANMLWAWASVGVSVLAAVVLALDWVVRRGKGRATRAGRGADGQDRGPGRGVAVNSGSVAPEDEVFDHRVNTTTMSSGGETRVAGGAPQRDLPKGGVPPGGVPGGPAGGSGAAGAVRQGDERAEPPEEATDAADLLVVSELSSEVRVVDERPRYHLDECGWLGSRPTIGLPVSEARQLGFTPCARCSPDATLAVEYRTLRGARRR